METQRKMYVEPGKRNEERRKRSVRRGERRELEAVVGTEKINMYDVKGG